MFGRSFNQRISVKVIRNGETDVSDDTWMEFSPAERIDAVWTLTKLCLAWNSDSADELRLRRTITNLQRSQR
jgi:hypothetical protein